MKISRLSPGISIAWEAHDMMGIFGFERERKEKGKKKKGKKKRKERKR